MRAYRKEDLKHIVETEHVNKKYYKSKVKRLRLKT